MTFEGLQYLLMLAVAAAFAVVTVRRWQAAQRRREALVAYALSAGWLYQANDPSLLWRYPGPPFGSGDDPSCGPVVRGTTRAGRPFVAFEYVYVEVTSGSNGRRQRRRRTFAVVALGLPTGLPALTVVPETWGDRVLQGVGLAQEVRLESEGFNRAFRVQAPEPRDAYDLLTPRTMEALLARPRFAWRTIGGDLLAWDEGGLEVTGLLAMLDVLGVVADGVPGYVWDDQARRERGPETPADPRFPHPPQEGPTP